MRELRLSSGKVQREFWISSGSELEIDSGIELRGDVYEVSRHGTENILVHFDNDHTTYIPGFLQTGLESCGTDHKMDGELLS